MRLARPLALAAAFVALAGCGGDEQAEEGPAQPGTTTATETDGGLPEGWTLCSNQRAGYAIGYPADWHTATLNGEFECSFFDPEPFEIVEGSEFPLTALQAFPAGEEGRSFDEIVEGYADPMFESELGREETEIQGFSAVRLETEATGEGLYDKGTKTIAYIVDRDVAPFVVRAQAFPGGELHEDVLDQAVRTVRFFEPAGSDEAGGEGQAALPPAVADKRAALLEAAENGDYDGLAALAPEEGFTYTFGGPVEGGPAAYWRDRAAGGAEDPAATLVAILELPYTKTEDIYVWPFAYDRDLSTLTEEEKEALAPVMSPEELEQWTQFGGYIGWRAGIREDGTWMFFVAGD